MDLSICIAGYNSKKFMRECLDSIFNSEADLPMRVNKTNEPLSFEVIYIDDASKDDGADYVSEHFPEVIVLRNQSNLGFSRTNNRGIKISKGRYVLVLNADTFVKSHALTTLVNFLDVQSKVGAAGPQLLNPDGSIQVSGRPFPTIFSVMRELFAFNDSKAQVYRMSGRDYGVAQPIDEVSGAAIILRREVLDSVGLLDENFFLYYEDVDWCLRIRKAGWEIYYVPDAQIVHYWGQSTGQINLRAQLEGLWSAFYYFRKHHGLRGAFSITSLHAVRDLMAYLVQLGRLLQLKFVNKLPNSNRAEHSEKISQIQAHLKIIRYRLIFVLAYWPWGVSAVGERKKFELIKN